MMVGSDAVALNNLDQSSHLTVHMQIHWEHHHVTCMIGAVSKLFASYACSKHASSLITLVRLSVLE